VRADEVPITDLKPVLLGFLPSAAPKKQAVECAILRIASPLEISYAPGYIFGKRKDAMPRLFIGNIPHASSDVELRQWVESSGFRVESAEIIYDRTTRKSRGFGFVTLNDKEDISKAVHELNGRRMNGRVLTVNEATPLPGRSERFIASARSVRVQDRT
jgi:hypothetical protein